MMQRNLPPLVLFLALALAAATGVQAAGQQRFYRYQDDQGVTVLNNTIPPEYVSRGYEVVDAHGRVVETVPPAKSAEEIAAEEAARERREAQQREAERRAREQAQKDQRLLITYVSESDLIAMRDSKLAVLESQIHLAEEKIGRLREQLQQQQTAAANHERAGRAVPETLLADIARSRQQIADNRNFMEERRRQRAELETQFAADLVRYRELRALPEAQQRALMRGQAPALKR
jgi:hypothetical protein